MAGQGAVYVRSLEPLESEDEGDTEEELVQGELFVCVFSLNEIKPV